MLLSRVAGWASQVVMMGGFGGVFCYSIYMLNLNLVDMAGFMTPMFAMMGAPPTPPPPIVHVPPSS